MLASRNCGHSILEVILNRRNDQHHIHICLSQHVIHVAEPARHAKLLRALFGALGYGIDHRDQINALLGIGTRQMRQHAPL